MVLRKVFDLGIKVLRLSVELTLDQALDAATVPKGDDRCRTFPVGPEHKSLLQLLAEAPILPPVTYVLMAGERFMAGFGLLLVAVLLLPAPLSPSLRLWILFR